MARLAVVAALFGAAVALVIGCGPAKELPDVVPKTVEHNDVPAMPTKSDPAAKAYIEKAVKALTGGKPELLEKVKASRVVLKGTFFILDGHQPTVRTIATVWPDRLSVTNEITAPNQKLNVRMWLHRPRVTLYNDEQEIEVGNRAEMELSLAASAAAELWMALLVPATDPKAVVFDLQTSPGTAPVTGEPMTLQLVKLSLGDLPLFQLTFDAKTDLLVRVEYVGVDQGVRRRKQWTVLEKHKPGALGLMLPTKTEFRQDGVEKEKWEIEKWEFPESIPDTEFDPPLKK